MVQEPPESTTASYLVIQDGPRAGKRLEIWKDRTTIGRSRDCDIFLEDITVHRKQASIVRTANGYLLRDDHGRGDSFVNERPVKEHLLKDGDQLLFGNTRLTFFGHEGTRPFQLASSRGDLAVSRLHATIRQLPGGGYEIEDHRSATGTYVNSLRIARYRLLEGDVVQIGSNRLTFRRSHA